jgi:hypothetical protein
MTNMEICIVSYNSKAIIFGMRLFYVGFCFLFINIIPSVWENYGMVIVYVAFAMMCLGAIGVNYYSQKTKRIGSLKFENGSTRILIGEIQIDLLNHEYDVKFSNSGYEGKSNYIPFLTIGSLTTNPGINTIYFSNNQNKFEYEVLIDSKVKHDKLQSIINKEYRSVN